MDVPRPGVCARRYTCGLRSHTRNVTRVAGIAGPVNAPYYTAAQKHWVSGTVYLDRPQFRELLQGVDGWAAARAIVMHELAHLVGLTHVSASDQPMYEKNLGRRRSDPATEGASGN
jgi:hypothetical protein